MIEQAFSWLGQLAEAIGSLVPRLLVVKTTDRALKYRYGKDRILLEPGLHWYWPVVTELEWCCVVTQVMVHRPHVIETRDGVPVVVGGVTSYRVTDSVQYLTENEDPEKTIDDVVAAAIRQVVVTEDYDVLGSGLTKTNSRLTRASRSLLRPFGVSVAYTRLTDFAKTRPLHLTGLPDHLPHA